MKFKLLVSTILISVFSLTLISTTPLFADDDDHFINADHYFITKEKFTQGWIYVTLATLKTEATPQTKNEAEFITVRDGEEIWTKFYYKTRIADKNEIKRGLEVIICEVNEDDIYRAPQDKDEAFQNNWFMAKITDISDVFKGYVTVSGGYKVKVDNLRVVVKK
jgi:hypothetical protein